MHSSRMRTSHCGVHGGGGVCPSTCWDMSVQEVSAPGHAGICLPCGLSASVHAGIDIPPVNRMTDRQV